MAFYFRDFLITVQEKSRLFLCLPVFRRKLRFFKPRHQFQQDQNNRSPLSFSDSFQRTKRASLSWKAGEDVHSLPSAAYSPVPCPPAFPPPPPLRCRRQEWYATFSARQGGLHDSRATLYSQRMQRIRPCSNCTNYTTTFKIIPPRMLTSFLTHDLDCEIALNVGTGEFSGCVRDTSVKTVHRESVQQLGTAPLSSADSWQKIEDLLVSQLVL